MQLIEYSAQSNDLALLWNADNFSFIENISASQLYATIENQDSDTIYNTKYMLAIGKKHNALKCSFLSIPHKVMI